jgi:predicted transposase YdaD
MKWIKLKPWYMILIKTGSQNGEKEGVEAERERGREEGREGE